MSASPAYSQAALEAKRNGKPYHKLITTTPGDVKTPHGLWAFKFLKHNAANFTEEMYDWTTEKVEEFIENNSKNNFVLIEFSYKQLGRSEDWFRKQCRELNGDMFKIKREILLEWNSASDLCPFTEEQVVRIKENCRQPLFSLFIKDRYQLKIYKDFDFTKTYIIGCDCATGMSLDSSSLIVCDPDNRMEVVAEFNNNTIDTMEFAEFIYTTFKKYFRNSVYVIERNSVGKAILDFLCKTDMEPRLYYEIKSSTAERKMSDIRKVKSSQMTRVYGINTDSATRPKMLDILTHCVNDNYEYINSPTIADEIGGLERKKNGKVEHSDMSHDDSLFGFLIAHYVWSYGTNLNAFFIYKKKQFGDITNEYDDYDVLDRNSADQEYMNRFNSVARFNKDHNVVNKSFTAQSMIDEYLEQQQYLREREQEEKILRQNTTLNMLNSFYNNNY